MQLSDRFTQRCLSLGLAATIATVTAAAPAYAATPIPASAATVAQLAHTPTPSPRPAQKPGGFTGPLRSLIAFTTGTSTPLAGRLLNPPGGWNPPTLKIDDHQPSLPIEGQQLQVSFQLTNNSTAFPLTGTVVESGNGQDTFGGTMSITKLAPGATISGVVRDKAPTAGKNLEIGLNFTGNIQDGKPAPSQVGDVTCSDCGGTPTSTSAQTNIDVAAMFVVSLDSFHVNSTRGIPDADYVGLASFSQGPGISIGYPATWGPSNVANSDDRRVGIANGPYTIVPDDSVALGVSYGIVSDLNGSSAGAVNALNSVEWDTAVAMGNKLRLAIGNPGEIYGDPAGSDPTVSLPWLTLSGAIPFTFCDGVVVQDEFALTGTKLMQLTATGPHTETHTYIGPEFGCGGAAPRSNYDLTWSITRG